MTPADDPITCNVLVWWTLGVVALALAFAYAGANGLGWAGLLVLLCATRLTDLAACLPGYAVEAIREALPQFDRRVRGFALEDAVMTGVETRTSSPLRIPRGDDGQSVNTSGLFPAGEGAGYAGGILSAGVDGIRAAEAVAGAMAAEA